jgi:hypothetical protein
VQVFERVVVEVLCPRRCFLPPALSFLPCRLPGSAKQKCAPAGQKDAHNFAVTAIHTQQDREGDFGHENRNSFPKHQECDMSISADERAQAARVRGRQAYGHLS